MLGSWAETGGDEQSPYLVAVKASGMGLVVEPEPPHMQRRRVVEQLFFNSVAVETGHGAKTAADGGTSTALGFELPAEALDVSPAHREQVRAVVAAPAHELAQVQGVGISREPAVAGREPARARRSRSLAAGSASTTSVDGAVLVICAPPVRAGARGLERRCTGLMRQPTVRGNRAHWSRPEPVVTGLIPALQARGARRVLDVGAGIGRHALAYARAGFEVIATDASPAGLAELTRSADAEGLTIEARLASFTTLPVEDADVDHVLAWNVIYHGERDIVAAALAECRRVLRTDGTLQLTMLSKRHRAYRVGREVRPDTFVDDTSTGDKEHPHFYVDAGGLTELLAETGFDLVSLVDVDQQPPGGFHWSVLAEVSP